MENNNIGKFGLTGNGDDYVTKTELEAVNVRMGQGIDRCLKAMDRRVRTLEKVNIHLREQIDDILDSQFAGEEDDSFVVPDVDLIESSDVSEVLLIDDEDSL